MNNVFGEGRVIKGMVGASNSSVSKKTKAYLKVFLCHQVALHPNLLVIKEGFEIKFFFVQERL